VPVIVFKNPKTYSRKWTGSCDVYTLRCVNALEKFVYRLTNKVPINISSKTTGAEASPLRCCQWCVSKAKV